MPGGLAQSLRGPELDVTRFDGSLLLLTNQRSLAKHARGLCLNRNLAHSVVRLDRNVAAWIARSWEELPDFAAASL